MHASRPVPAMVCRFVHNDSLDAAGQVEMLFKVIVEVGTERILGVHLCGHNAIN